MHQLSEYYQLRQRKVLACWKVATFADYLLYFSVLNSILCGINISAAP